MALKWVPANQEKEGLSTLSTISNLRHSFISNIRYLDRKTFKARMTVFKFNIDLLINFWIKKKIKEKKTGRRRDGQREWGRRKREN